MNVRFRLAVPDDNEALLALARRSPMEGRDGRQDGREGEAGQVSVAVERSPDHFALPRLQGDPWLVAVAEDEQGRIVATSSLATREVYLDGEPVRCMYGGDLRVAPEVRGCGVARGLHDWCWERTREHGVDLWYASIMVGNRPAAHLPDPTPGRPRYRRVGRAVVVAVALGAGGAANDELLATPATAADLSAVAALLDGQGRRRAFGPVWTEQRLRQQVATAPGLSVADLLVVRRAGELVACAAVWDQSAVQRTLVGGHPVAIRYLTHLGTAGDGDAAAFRVVVDAARRAPSARGADLLVFALDEHSPLLAGVDDLPAHRLLTEVWFGAWPGTPWDRRAVPGLVHHEASHVW